MYLLDGDFCNHHEIFVCAAHAGDSALALPNPGYCYASKFSRCKASLPQGAGWGTALAAASLQGEPFLPAGHPSAGSGQVLSTGSGRALSPGERVSGSAQQHDAARNSVCREHRDTSSPAKHRAGIRWQRYVPEAQCRFHSTANASPLRGSRRSGAISASGPSTQGCSRSGRGKINAGSSRMQSPNSTRSASSV